MKKTGITLGILCALTIVLFGIKAPWAQDNPNTFTFGNWQQAITANQVMLPMANIGNLDTQIAYVPNKATASFISGICVLSPNQCPTNATEIKAVLDRNGIYSDFNAAINPGLGGVAEGETCQHCETVCFEGADGTQHCKTYCWSTPC